MKKQFALDPVIPTILQVSRFDKFKDPIGVISTYKIAKRFIQLQLVLAGEPATDGPESQKIFANILKAAKGDRNIHVLLLPPDAHITINALQRSADLIIQKSLKEGFGLTVTEAMWKDKTVIGGDTGGIKLQVINHYTGFLVNTPEGTALRIRYFMHNKDRLKKMSKCAQNFVKDNFLITRHLREYLALMVGILKDEHEHI